ncbi:hypothetical protein SAMN04488023_104164 [Pedobacter rhizosphaerae]|uniref:Uncharacterized protein n=1 Tax=Pedobacter rhizosphaerae TaxID=390241 RepID=A0A1H9LIS0_9SPHI|nr:hypothetical protein SAMN04488023_104164 [Pedobacter rhizosphaerae]
MIAGFFPCIKQARHQYRRIESQYVDPIIYYDIHRSKIKRNMRLLFACHLEVSFGFIYFFTCYDPYPQTDYSPNDLGGNQQRSNNPT